MAYNTAQQSENRIHADDVARQFGFTGGLVPGVDVYAYMTWAPVARWGIDWLSHGVADVRFPRPTYDGDTVTVTMIDDGQVTVTDPVGEHTGTGTAALAHGDPPPTRHPWVAAPDYARRPLAGPESLVAGQPLGSVDMIFDADAAEAYLADVREVLPIYREQRIAHPGWISRLGNEILMANVRMGPWMHVGHRIAHHGLIRHGAHVSCRGVLTAEYERKGHRFEELDATVTADDTVVATIHHVAIYEPRQVRGL